MEPVPKGILGGIHRDSFGKGTRYWATIQVHPVRYLLSDGVKVLSPAMSVVSEADAVHLAEGSILVSDKQGIQKSISKEEGYDVYSTKASSA